MNTSVVSRLFFVLGLQILLQGCDQVAYVPPENLKGANIQSSTVSEKSCVLDGQTIEPGESALFYQAANVPYGQTCSSQTRSCNNGTLSGSYTFTSCRVNVAPTVAISSPIAGATVSGTINLTATATGGGSGGVRGVQFFINNIATGAEDTVAPYTISLATNTISNGSYQVTARVTDATGVQVTSTAVSFTVQNTTVSTTGLVAAFSFNENMGAVAKDASDSKLQATLTNVTWSPAGRFGSALSFNGTTSYAKIPNALALNAKNEMTLEAWVFPTQLLPLNGISTRTILLREDSISTAAFGLYGALESANRAAASVRPGGVERLTGAAVPTLELNKWTHLAVTYKAPELKLYVNGVQVGLQNGLTGALANLNRPLFIGGWPNLDEYFAGRIDEVRIYNRALSPSEIQIDMGTPVLLGP